MKKSTIQKFNKIILKAFRRIDKLDGIRHEYQKTLMTCLSCECILQCSFKLCLFIMILELRAIIWPKMQVWRFSFQYVSSSMLVQVLFVLLVDVSPSFLCVTCWWPLVQVFRVYEIGTDGLTIRLTHLTLNNRITLEIYFVMVDVNNITLLSFLLIRSKEPSVIVGRCHMAQYSLLTLCAQSNCFHLGLFFLMRILRQSCQ